MGVIDIKLIAVMFDNGFCNLNFQDHIMMSITKGDFLLKI